VGGAQEEEGGKRGVPEDKGELPCKAAEGVCPNGVIARVKNE